MSQAMQGAANILAQIDISSGVSTDQIARDIAQSLNQSNSASATFAGVVLAACWIIGIIDSYRLAKKKQDKQGE